MRYANAKMGAPLFALSCLRKVKAYDSTKYSTLILTLKGRFFSFRWKSMPVCVQLVENRNKQRPRPHCPYPSIKRDAASKGQIVHGTFDPRKRRDKLHPGMHHHDILESLLSGSIYRKNLSLI